MEFFHRDPFAGFDASMASPFAFPCDAPSPPSPSSLHPPMSFDQYPTPSVSRRGSACSTASSMDDAMQSFLECSASPQARLTPEQALLLERQFSESPKPSTKVRRTLAEVTGLSVQRVANWFQNRRAKAKLQKRQEELHTRKILESAGRRRATEPSSPNHSSLNTFNQSSSPSLAHRPADGNMLTTPQQPRRTKSTSAIPSTPAETSGLTSNHSPYASPSEASYASLARSMAVAAAAKAQADASGGDPRPSSYEASSFLGNMGSNMPCPISFDGTQSPWPVSAFSDYGSSVASSVTGYTPTPYTQLEDPFEFDRSFNSQPPSRGEPSYFAEPPTVDYEAFAAAIQMNTISHTLTPPPVPRRPLKERRQSPWKLQLSEQEPEEQAQNMQKDEPASVAPDQHMVDEQDACQDVLAIRRRRPRLTPLALRSHSYYGAEFNGSRLSPVPTMRRTRSIGSSSGRQRRISKSPGPRSPLHFERSIESSVIGDWPDSAATIHPRTAGSLSVPKHPVSEIFSQNAAPPTPVSPADSNPSADRSGNDRQPDSSPLAARSRQISPPPTPLESRATSNPGGSKAMDEEPIGMDFQDFSRYLNHDAASVPRGLYGPSPEAMHDFDSFGMEDLRHKAAPFPFECYVSSSSPTSSPHVATAASGTSF